MSAPYALAVHGGAGVKPDRDYREAERHLAEVAREGAAQLERGGAGIDVVEWAVAEMERSGLYVAGRGATPQPGGGAELDAAIMDGATGRAGAVAAVRDVVSPIAVARSVMTDTRHVLLVGEGAAKFARARGDEFVADPATYYRTPVGMLTEDRDGGGHGTVGAVALDQTGRLAAATSTGGICGKLDGRVCDTPLIGAGTWADRHVAVSCTGLGEAFILANAAADVSARSRYLGEDVQVAAESVLARVIELGGDGGLIVVDRGGHVVFAFTGPGMKRARAGSLYRGVEAGAYELQPGEPAP